eukprot:c9759_g1_i1 orf=147-704(+)
MPMEATKTARGRYKRCTRMKKCRTSVSHMREHHVLPPITHMSTWKHTTFSTTHEVMLRARDIHNDTGTGNGNRSTDPIPKIGLVTIDGPAPEEGEQDEEASVGGICAAEVLELEGGDDTIGDENKCPQYQIHPHSSFPPPLPHQPSSTYLTYCRCDEQKHRQCRFGACVLHLRSHLLLNTHTHTH